MAVSEGSVKDFIKNFRQISELIKKNYGLTKSESEALNNEHMAQATNRMLGTLLAGSAIASGPAVLPIAATVEASLGILNQGRKAASGELVDDTDELVASRFRDKNGKVTKQRRDLASAQNKIRKTGIYSPGAFNDFLNNSFLENLRSTRSTKKADVKEEPIRIIDKVQLPSVLNDLKPVKTIDTNILNDSNALREFLRSNGYK